jgi:hypothetical protein
VKLAVEPFDQRQQAWAGRGAVEEVVRRGGFLFDRHLAANAPDGFGAGESVAFVQAGDLGFTVGGDDDDLVHALVDAGFRRGAERRK